MATTLPVTDTLIWKYKIDAWSLAVLNFSSLFHKNKIFFSLDNVELMNSINNEMEIINEKTTQFLAKYQNVEQQIEAINKPSPEFMALKRKSDISLGNTIELEKSLENEFREILGVEIK